MYGLIFRVLPGPLWLRILMLMVLIVLAVAALVVWVFPWLSEFDPFTDSTLETALLT